jgi:putative membrane protein insertion efficiency factor
MAGGLIKTVITTALIKLVRVYRFIFSLLLPPSCRFEPTCSQYAIEVLQAYGCVKGTWKTLHRLLRCHPWHSGGVDPVNK